MKKLFAILLALALVLGLLPFGAFAAETQTPVLTFGSDGITETVAGAGYEISETALSITAAGTYTVTGSCGEGNVVVKKGVTGVTLILQDLTLACSSTAPLACNKTSEATVQIEGTVRLTDNEDPANETSTDTEIADAFEGAAIKVKSGAKLTVTGSGDLTVDGSACKNGIKGGATSTLTFDPEGTVTVKAANNGIAADGEIFVKNGRFSITAGNEGIKAEPDEDDTASKGEITISGGTLNITAESDGIQAANLITITGGDFTINAQRDGIQSNGNLTISDGTFEIRTFGGYNASGFNEDTMSCKGLKASSSDEDVENATNTITISGGSFSLNTRDDAVHSDGYVYVTGGSFDIRTGDDGMHADTELHLGSEGGLARDPDVRINTSYEGLEAGNLYIYGGRYYVTASDDGINAAGGTGDHFNPWNPGGPGSGFPGQPGQPGGGGGDYSINISGGQVYVNCSSDGLDSNGTLNLTGGVIEVWSMSSGDNSPLDADGTTTVKGATVFAAGAKGVDGYPSPQGGQTYKNYTSGLSISSGKVVSIKNGSTVVFQTAAPKSAQFVFYSAPGMSTSWTCSAAAGSVSCAVGDSWSHSWNEGVETTAPTTGAAGLRTFTCTVCGATETQTIPMLATEPEPPVEEPDEGFVVTFRVDDACLDVYATQDLTGEVVLGLAPGGFGTDVSRNGTTGEPDSTGEGQVNFVVELSSGYELDAVTATEGTYKNIKLVAAEGRVYTYRVTKITADCEITVTTAPDGTTPVDEGFPVSFTTDAHSSLAVYATQDVTAEAILTVAENSSGADVSRNSVTGEPDSTGDGQVNFTITVAEGYTLDAVTALDGTYKNIKEISDGKETGVYVYRVTKITAGTAISVTTKEAESDPCAGGHECALVGEVPATCTEDGTAAYLRCGVCGKCFSYETYNESGELVEVTAEELVLPALGHDWGEPEYVWAEDLGSCAASRACTRCEAEETETAESTSVVTTAPTLDAEGVLTYTAAFENPAFETQTKTEPIPKLEPTDPCAEGHDWDEPEYVWAEDYSTCTATRVCKNNPEHNETEIAKAEGAVTKPATEEEEGEIIYTAKFENEAFGVREIAVALPKLEPEPGNPFEDVEEGKFYYDAVLWAVSHEPQITNGVDDTHFAPGNDCTRGQVVTFLWRAHGCPEPNSVILSEAKNLQGDSSAQAPQNDTPQNDMRGANPFSDVSETAFYYKAVLWAVENNITKGVDDTHFGPDSSCTRGQVVTFLWRAAGEPAATGSDEEIVPGENETPIVPLDPDEPAEPECAFEDVNPEAYYYQAMLWAVANGITKGTSDTTFAPGNTCTRGQVVTFLYRAE